MPIYIGGDPYSPDVDAVYLGDTKIWAPQSANPVAFDAAGVGDSFNGPVGSRSPSITATPGATVLLWVHYANTSANPGITATYDGLNMALVGGPLYYGSSGSYRYYLGLFKLHDAPGGTKTAIVTPAASSYMKTNMVSYLNAGSVGNPATATGNDAAPSLPGVPSAPGHRVAQCFVSRIGGPLSAYSQTARWNNNTGWPGAPMCIGDADGASSIDFTAQLAATSLWGGMAVDLAN